MKKFRLFAFLSIALVLSSCSWNNPKPTSTSSTTSQSSSSSSSSTSSSTSGSSTSQSSSSSSSSSTSKPRPTGKVDIGFSCINDFHGAINELTGSNPQPGLAKVAGYLKAKKNQGNILINSGDMWQGTFESNFNSGELVTKAFKEIGFDASILGNHEFDWRVEQIRKNQTTYGEDFLCANIMQYNASGNPSYVGDRFDLGSTYKIVESNGVRVGIIGVIGKDQFSSIDSQNTKDFVFLDPTPIVQEISTNLRQNHDCQIVVASYHAASYDAGTDILGTDEFGNRYVDAVFCAHSHQQEGIVEELHYGDITEYVPYIQSGCNGWYCGNVTLTYDWDTGRTTLNQDLTTWNESITHSSVAADPVVASLVSEYNAASSSAGNVVLGSATRQISKDIAANMTAKGMYDLCQENNETDVVLAMTNVARNNIYSGTVKMSDAITCLPFNNQIVVCDVTGNDLYKECRYNYVYNPSHLTFSYGDTTIYRVAVCSYVAYHAGMEDNYRKYYNYFPSITNIHELDDGSGNLIYYRDGLLKQFEDQFGNYGNTINPDNYMGEDYNA